MKINLSNGIHGYFNSFKNCWEFKQHNKVIRTCEDNELNETIDELLMEVK